MPPYFGDSRVKRSATRAGSSLTSDPKLCVPEFQHAIHCNLSSNIGSAASVYPIPIVWKNVLLFIILHSSLLYSLYAILTDWPVATIMFATAVGMTSGLGVTVGAHRLWSHRSYKAKLPLRIFLMIMQTTAGQNDIYEWCRDHRVHHKFSETDADPHNAKRGFFFSHMGWLMVKKHPDVLIRGASVHMNDLLHDPVVRFQKKFKDLNLDSDWIDRALFSLTHCPDPAAASLLQYYVPLSAMFCIIIPTLIPYYCWSETFMTSFMMAGMARYCVSLHITWLVNSAAHLWGNKPYDEDIGARQNPYVSFGSMGEGWHNFHHTFPWDYATSEFGYKLNLSKVFIDAMAWIGQAYDLKQAGPEIVLDRRKRTGDLSGRREHEHEEYPDPSCEEDEGRLHEEILPSTSL